MSPLDEYRQLMIALFKSRQEHAKTEDEDALLDAMDPVWYRMSIEERSIANALSDHIASGELSEEQFIAMYAKTGGNVMSEASLPTPEFRIEIQPSDFVQSITSTTVGIAVAEGTYYIGFAPPLDQARIQVGHVLAGDEHA